ncbi:ycf24 [Symbiodinium sp. CCMP2592]|nr:ycf24 [Symbiodinium sp. CCMP2592]
MAGPGIFSFLDLPPPEEEPAPQNESRDSSDDSPAIRDAPAEKAANSFFPTISTAGLLHDSDSDGDGLYLQHPGQVPQDVLAVACEPPPESFPGLPTHVVLKVLSIEGLPLRKEERNVPGSKGLGYFMEGKDMIDRSGASAAILPEPQSRPPGRHRCAEPRIFAELSGDHWEAVWDHPGEVRVKLKDGQDSVVVGILLGQEVVAVTAELDLTGTMRRFFQPQQLYRPKFSGVALGLIEGASAKLALELYPPGSQLPGRAVAEPERPSAVRLPKDVPISDCRFCDGYGRRSCDGCGGHGVLVCSTCDGMPALPCPVCRGRGTLHDNLEGIGGPRSRRAQDGAVLITVKGRRCQNCWGAPLTCKECFGAAALRCNVCNGAGWSEFSAAVPTERGCPNLPFCIRHELGSDDWDGGIPGCKAGSVELKPKQKQEEAVALRDGQNAELGEVLDQEYSAGFYTNIESESLPKGLNEDIVRKIWEIKEEPEWMLEFRLNAFRKWKQMKMPEWAQLQMEEIDFQDIVYYSRPKTKKKKQSLDEVDPELLDTFEKLGIPLTEQKRLTNVAVDAVFDSESIGTTFQKELAEAGVIFCSINEAIKEHPELVKKYLGSVVPVADNYFAALNSAVFSDGSFCYIPKGTTCPMEISTYFRINNQESGQFERTLLIADESSYVSYLEGCTASVGEILDMPWRAEPVDNRGGE